MTTSSADCGDSEIAQPPSGSIKLCTYSAPMTTTEKITRTADYLKDPLAYLERHRHDNRDQPFCISSTYEKDVYGSGGHKVEFEKYIAKYLGKEYGLFFITGVQAQCIALKLHSRGMHAAWHVSSHLESAEERAYQELYGLQRTLVGTDTRSLPSIDDIRQVINTSPAVLLLELPNRIVGCTTYTWSELEEISKLCRAANVKLHLDGARLWDIEPYYQSQGKSIKEITALFDTVYVSFYKGLGGVTGAMLVSDDAVLIQNAKMWQRRAGGNPYTLYYETIDCERGFNENVGTFTRKWQKMVDIAKQIQAATSSYKVGDKQVIELWPQEPVCRQVRTVFNGYTEEELDNARDRVEATTGIRVYDRLWPKFSLDEKLAADRAGVTDLKAYEDKIHEIEWVVGDATEKIDTSVFVKGYVCLCEELQRT